MKRFLLYTLLLINGLCGSHDANGQCNTAPGVARTTGNVNFGSSINWATPNDVDSDNDVYARAKMNTGDTTKYHLSQDFGFIIPSTATITGIEVRVQKRQNSLADIQDASVRLVWAGSVTGDDKALPLPWPILDAYTVYGGPLDTWGLNLTPQQVMDPDFGFVLSATRTGGILGSPAAYHAFIDHIEMRIYYLDPSCLLGVDFVKVEARRQASGEVSLNWVTARETSIDRFEVQRSTDGEQFEQVSALPAIAEEGHGASYDLLDQDAPADRAWYRIKEVDADGGSTYSEIMEVDAARNAPSAVLQSYPSPATERLHLKTGQPLVELRVHDLSGKLVLQETGSKSVDVSQLIPGYYLLRARTESGTWLSSRFIKQ